MRLEVDDGRSVRSVRVTRADATLGCSNGVDVRVQADGVSRRHVSLRTVGDAIEVVDLDSRNGLHVMGQRVPRAILGTGDSFQVGAARVTVLPATAPPSATARAAAAAVAAAGVSTGPLVMRRALGAPATAAGSAGGAGVDSAGPRDAAASVAQHGVASAADFDELLWAGLRKAPWFLLSMGLHAALLLLLATVDLGLSGEPPPPDDVVVVLADGTTDDGLDEQIAELLVDDALDDLERLVPDDPHEEPVPFDPAEPDDPADTEWLADPQDLLDREAEPFGVRAPGDLTLGILPGGAGALPLGRTFGKDQAADANAFAARQLRASPFSRRILDGLKLRANHVNVRVLGGEYDQCEDVLDRLGLEHDTLLPEELDLSAPGREIRAIFYNCTSKPLTERALDHLERFVRDGGYLFTTDWGLENVLERRFSAYVRTLRRRGRVVMTDDEVIGFDPVAAHPLLRGLPAKGGDSRWWLENSSLLVDIVDHRRVEVLIESDDLQRRHGSRVVAVTFPHGQGRVVHVLGHFFQKEGNLRGTVAMQRILINFLYQALRAG